MSDSSPLPISDEYRGNNEELRAEIKTLIELNDAKSPHGVGMLARHLLSAAYHRLARRPSHEGAGEAIACRIFEWFYNTGDGGLNWPAAEDDEHDLRPKYLALANEVLALSAAPSPDHAGELAKALPQYASDALAAAQAFIRNGVELGYIQMPKSNDDPAHRTLGLIDTAMRKNRQALGAFNRSQSNG